MSVQVQKQRGQCTHHRDHSGAQGSAAPMVARLTIFNRAKWAPAGLTLFHRHRFSLVEEVRRSVIFVCVGVDSVYI